MAFRLGLKSCVLCLLGTALGSTASGSITKGLPSTRTADGPSYRGSITHVGAGGRVGWAGILGGLGWDERTSGETRDLELNGWSLRCGVRPRVMKKTGVMCLQQLGVAETNHRKDSQAPNQTVRSHRS